MIDINLDNVAVMPYQNGWRISGIEITNDTPFVGIPSFAPWFAESAFFVQNIAGFDAQEGNLTYTTYKSGTFTQPAQVKAALKNALVSLFEILDELNGAIEDYVAENDITHIDATEYKKIMSGSDLKEVISANCFYISQVLGELSEQIDGEMFKSYQYEAEAQRGWGVSATRKVKVTFKGDGAIPPVIEKEAQLDDFGDGGVDLPTENEMRKIGYKLKGFNGYPAGSNVMVSGEQTFTADFEALPKAQGGVVVV